MGKSSLVMDPFYCGSVLAWYGIFTGTESHLDGRPCPDQQYCSRFPWSTVGLLCSFRPHPASTSRGRSRGWCLDAVLSRARSYWGCTRQSGGQTWWRHDAMTLPALLVLCVCVCVCVCVWGGGGGGGGGGVPPVWSHKGPVLRQFGVSLA